MAGSERWHRVAALADLREDEALAVRVGELELALVRIEGDEVYVRAPDR